MKNQPKDKSQELLEKLMNAEISLREYKRECRQFDLPKLR